MYIIKVLQNCIYTSVLINLSLLSIGEFRHHEAEQASLEAEDLSPKLELPDCDVPRADLPNDDLFASILYGERCFLMGYRVLRHTVFLFLFTDYL